MVSIRASAVKGKRAKHNRLAWRVNSGSNNKKPGANPLSSRGSAATSFRIIARRALYLGNLGVRNLSLFLIRPTLNITRPTNGVRKNVQKLAPVWKRV